jgi:TolA-binding protein
VSVVDLHPENLLDREIRGELDAAERERLEAHLAQCATCRFERQLRAGFALELSRDSVPPEIAGLVDTLAKQGGGSPVPVPVPLPVVVRSRGRRVKLVLLAAAATLTVVVGAFASTEAGRRAIAPFFFGREGSTTQYGEAVPPTVTAGPHAPALQSSAAPASVPLATLPGPSALAEAPQPPVAVAPAIPVNTPPAPPATLIAAPPEGPGALFGAEAEARRRGDTSRMMELHAELVARYPQSHEAQVSRMMVARLLLDRGDAAGALSGFDAYLRAGTGELREDALGGRATALERMGRTDEARRAWMTLLDQYPNTAYGAHARSRVEASGGH